jgi:indoleamine 2,3-dioxygenase
MEKPANRFLRYIKWLPNQLSAVMDLMIATYDKYLKDAPIPMDEVGSTKPNFIATYRKQLDSMMEEVRDQREKLAREVERWCQERGV